MHRTVLTLLPLMFIVTIKQASVSPDFAVKLMP
uniref:Uncharacterized protein n=1 Tax=Arundo donax TaxID=35708 RepID=A0A0A9CGZ5_ARUDO